MAIHARSNYNVLGCGATVVRNLGDPDQDPVTMLKALLNAGVRWTFMVMADLQPKRLNKAPSGVKLKKFIEEHDLGPIIETEGRQPSDIHEKGFIKIYVWRPDYKSKGFIEFCEENKIIPIRKMW